MEKRSKKTFYFPRRRKPVVKTGFSVITVEKFISRQEERNCLTCSKKHIAAQAATFKDSIAPM